MLVSLVKSIAAVSRRFSRDERGNIAVIAGMFMVPALAISGASIDFSRAIGARSELASALDSALLSLARSPNGTDEAAMAYINGFVGDTLSSNGKVLDWKIDSVTQTNSTIEATVSAKIKTTVLGVIHLEEIAVKITSEVTRENKKIEVALVLDNTGSMGSNGKIYALRDATNELLDTLFSSSNSAEMVKVAMVPFVTSVNIKASNMKMSWIDQTGAAQNSGQNFSYGSGPSYNWAIYQEMHGVEWKGCVEARPAPYDVQDVSPSTSNPNTLWVPWLWPDEPDYGWGYSNNYLNDGVSGYEYYRQAHTDKYVNSWPSIDETPSTTRGPNKSCPQPLRPLTNDVDALKADANSMTPWNNSGTNIALGLAWGWRVLSPEEPYTEGVAYDDEEVEKALILLTDGQNVVVSQNTHNKSDYNGYGYMSVSNLGTQSTWSAVNKVNDKVTTLCNSIKAKGIRIYTITFQLNDTDLKSVFKNCASAPNLYFDSPSNEELKNSFRSIAVDLSNLRLSK